MEITPELAHQRGIPPHVAAYLARFPDDDASTAHAGQLHQQHGMNATWPTLARYWLNQGHTWPQICHALGIDGTTDGALAELTKKNERQAETIKRQAHVIETQAHTIAALRDELKEAQAHAAAAAGARRRGH